MAFPFPLNPVDGQTVSHVSANGDLLKAVYDGSKNCWNVERAVHAPSVFLSRSGVTIPTASADKQVMMWDDTSKQWVASTIVMSTKDLADVDHTTDPADQYFLVFDAALKKYKPVPLTGGAVLTATTVGLNAQITTAGSTDAGLTALFKLARPASTPKGGDAYIITQVATNSVLDNLSGTYLYNGTTWIRAANDSGGAAAHYRPTVATAQEAGKKIGDIDVVGEINNRQINVYDGTVYQTILGESMIKQWIASGSLFQGTLTSDADLAALPVAGSTNRGFYWTWTGTASHDVTSPLTATLQVGDWIQSDGTKYIHVPSDLMSKLRWEAVGSFRTWGDANYEASTLIYHNYKLYRATAVITTGDAAPDAAGSKWQEIQIKPNIEDLLNVNDNVSVYGQDCVLVWDELNQEWTASRTIEIDAIEFDESGPGVQLSGLADASLTNLPPGTDTATWAASVFAVKDYVDYKRLEDLEDTQDLGAATDGQIPAWDATNNKWVPSSGTVASIADIGDVDISTIPTDGEALLWAAATNTWIPKSIPIPDTYTKAEIDAKVGAAAKIIAISAADYNALATKDPNTLYVLT